MMREDISRLNRNRPIYFKIGLLFALSFVIFAFNWTVYPSDPHSLVVPDYEEEMLEVIPNTPPEAPKLPPPSFAATSSNQDFNFQEILPPDPVTPLPVTPFPEPDPTPGPVYSDEPYPEPRPMPLPEKVEVEPPIIFSEIMPRFPGCEEEPNLSDAERRDCANLELLKYVQQRLDYPVFARDNGIEGTVVLRFIIEKDGSVSNPEIVKEIGGGCGKEALRVVKEMPTWKPGKQGGRPVRVIMNLPVKFKLQ